MLDELRERIVQGKEAPGSVITEAAVTDRFGVARPTAKAALERLVAEGLLWREANRAARVPRLEVPDIVDLYDSRLVIEEAVMRRLTTRRYVPREARAANRELLALAEDGEDGDETYISKADTDFHRALVVATESPRLIRMHSVVMGETRLCMGQLRALHVISPRTSATEHQALLEAVASGDIELAADRIRRHIERARDGLVSARERQRMHTT